MGSGHIRYSSTPYGSSEKLNPKPRPRRSKREINQLFLLVFFAVLPIVGLLSLFLQPIRWLFIGAVVICLAAMWILGGFKFPGRLVTTGIYGLLTVITLVSVLSVPRQRSVKSVTFQTPQPSSTPAFVGPTMGYGVISGDGMDVNTYGGEEQTSDFYEPEKDDGAIVVPSGERTEAEIALENFMEKWRKGIIADMVQYTSVAWRNAQKSTSQQDAAQQQLFWKFGQKPLQDWRQMSRPSGTDASTARTITVQADVTYSGESRTYEYEAIVINEDGVWYVDPNSLSTGTLVVQSTPTPDPNVTPTPEPDPTPTPTPGPKTQLYYNKNGGKRYHIDKKCPSLRSDQYKYMTAFNYGDLGKSPYNKLTRCEKCGAPEKK